MLHARSRPRHTSLLLGALLALLLVGLPGSARPAGAANASIAVDPNTLQISLPLGQSSTRTATITNLSSSALSPQIFESYPTPAPAARSRAQAGQAPQAVALPRQSSRLDTQLLADLQAAPDRQSDFLIYMRDQADLSAAEQITGWAERGRYVYQTLVDHAARSQRELRAQLTARGLTARPLWIVNAILVHGSLADAQALSARADVALIRANHTASLPQPEPAGQAAIADRCNPAQPSDPICWNIHQINADRVWRDFGVTGQGIVVSNIDTGVRFDHPALAAHYRGALGNGRYDHNYNWFDILGQHAAPQDDNGHGTHTMGTMIASGTSDTPTVGVAPGARWIAAQGCSAYACSESDLIGAAQWILAPTRLDGGQPRPDLRPMIVNNSWAGTGGSNWYAGYTAAWRAAGIFPIFAAGNATGGITQACGSIESPGDYADVVAVGATDQNDTIAGFSLLGPTIDGRRKPDFVAPGTYAGAGQGVLSTFPGAGSSYQVLRGTSMAAPHVAGLVALLWSANPTLIGDYDATYALIRDSARTRSDTRCGDPLGGPNNVYGYGRIDAYSAVARARVQIPWLSITAAPAAIQPGDTASFAISVDAARVPGPGTYNARVQIYGTDLTETPTSIEIAMIVTPASQQANLTGRVISADTGAPIAATVGVKDGLGVQTNSSGVYTLTLATGAYDLVASAPSFLPETLKVQADADQQLPDILMQPDQPRIAVPTTSLTTSVALGTPQTLSLPISNSGTRPLLYHLRVLPDQFAMLRSDEPGGPAYSWVDLPADAATITLGDNDTKEKVPLGIEFPFYGYTITDTLVTSDGTLAFSLPNQKYNGPISRCFPTSEFHFFVIAPFRADLDPSQGGAVRYGTIDGGTTFVLSYEQVPAHGDPSGATYTFQVLLHDDGRIVFQYHDLAALPARLGVGVQRSPEDAQAIGCGSATPITNQLAITFLPQLNAATWLHTPIDQGTALPNAQAEITATLQWARPLPRAIQRGRIEITSNDPIRSVVVLNIHADMLPPPYEHLLILLGNRQ